MKGEIKMKVKIGEVILDSNNQPIMLILSPVEKDLIANMGEETKICCHPSGFDEIDIHNFMKGGE